MRGFSSAGLPGLQEHANPLDTMTTTYRPIPVVSTVPARSPLPKLVELEDLHTLGWVQINHAGEENIYMTDCEGVEHYAKP